MSGPLDGSLVVTSDATNDAIYNLTLHGEAVEASGDLRLIAPTNNNLGGKKIGTTPVVAEDFLAITNRGASPLSVFDVRVTQGADQFAILGLPVGTNLAKPFVLAPGQTLSLDAAFGAASIGLQRGTIQIVTDDPENPITTLTVVGTGLSATGSTSGSGDYYVALRSGSGVINQQRTRSDASGNWKFTVPAGTTVTATLFDPASGLVVNDFGVVNSTTYDQTQVFIPFSGKHGE